MKEMVEMAKAVLEEVHQVFDIWIESKSTVDPKPGQVSSYQWSSIESDFGQQSSFHRSEQRLASGELWKELIRYFI